jgi:hypothetical protein
MACAFVFGPDPDASAEIVEPAAVVIGRVANARACREWGIAGSGTGFTRLFRCKALHTSIDGRGGRISLADMVTAEGIPR